ncbi:hypothetical protein [Pseudoxanthomonas sp. J35]|uniref:hypothetical protein n=1 Tax=Pseudoxanthomonas sp. J35 TaxID=935852 RepID=UPI0012EC808E|nr:hypothetical protein [Pseudoxanthomonas sp. J35]
MKMASTLSLGLCLALSAPAHAAIADQKQAPAPLPAVNAGTDDTAVPEAPQRARRSRLADPGPGDRPALKLSAFYQVSEPDMSKKDHCLKYTGTRTKREESGKGACTIGGGQVFVPER